MPGDVARECSRRYDPAFMTDQVTASNIFVHPQALCETSAVGENTRVWAFAHVLPGARIGKDCNICDHVFIENDVVIGDRVTIKCGVQLWDGLRVADEVFIGPNVSFSNDKYPKSKQYQPKVEQTHVGRGASIGGGPSILPGLRIGARAMVGAGAVVTHDVPARAVVSGNPARIVGYVDTKRKSEERPAAVRAPEVAIRETSVAGVSVHRLPTFADLRGSLSVGEFLQQIPFVPKRYFVVYDVPGKDVRGEHAHRLCRQFLVCLRDPCRSWWTTEGPAKKSCSTSRAWVCICRRWCGPSSIDTRPTRCYSSSPRTTMTPRTTSATTTSSCRPLAVPRARDGRPRDSLRLIRRSSSTLTSRRSLVGHAHSAATTTDTAR